MPKEPYERALRKRPINERLLQGREAGFVAMLATLASNDVDICLIPEASFGLDNLWLLSVLLSSPHS